ncbi:hypothetical protein ABW19_dt0200270 [Dactylella cylindrospora]|nr:hypothetical protein ABW19_dt0200270 [Dactylella cylindrospora]
MARNGVGCCTACPRETLIIQTRALEGSGDRDILKLNLALSAVEAERCLTVLILDGTAIDAGDVGHLLKTYQNVTTLSLRHCWNINLQLLYKLFKKTPKEHNDEVNFYNHVDQPPISSKCPAEQIEKLRIWDIDGIEPLLDEKSENGHRLVSQINVQFFMRNFSLDIRKCENYHPVFVVCVGERVKCGECNRVVWIEACPKCRLKTSCEICDFYWCQECISKEGSSSDDARRSGML